MTKKKNIQASNQNLVNSQDGIMNSLNKDTERQVVSKAPTGDFEQKRNSGIQSGIGDNKNK